MLAAKDSGYEEEHWKVSGSNKSANSRYDFLSFVITL